MRPVWFDDLSPKADAEALLALRQDVRRKLDDPRWAPWREAASLVADFPAKDFSVQDGAVVIGRPDELDAARKLALKQALDAFRPWKKGPFTIYGQAIDSEWRSDMKWSRVLPRLGSIQGEVIADIGCHNGYFMYRMLESGAKTVVGFEPVPVHYFNYQLLQTLAPTPSAAFELFGVEQIDHFPETFDTIFCMGILYHHTDPVGLLRKMRSALRPKGRVIIDCQGIAGADPVALTPSGRYAGAGGVWFLPTLSCLQNWIRRAGYGQQEVLYSAPLSTDEQRATDWAEVKSLADFLDPEDPSLTREGYPAPYRHFISARL